MTRTEKWLKSNNISNEEARKAGLLRDQIQKRYSRGLEVLRKRGLGDTQEAKMLEKATR
jgi:hypothetical protein